MMGCGARGNTGAWKMPELSPAFAPKEAAYTGFLPRASERYIPEIVEDNILDDQ
jgi:hypothetical protein